MIDPQFPKLCTVCGKSVASRFVWDALPLAGGNGLVDDGIDILELRNHPCGTTLAIVLMTREEAVVPDTERAPSTTESLRDARGVPDPVLCQAMGYNPCYLTHAPDPPPMSAEEALTILAPRYVRKRT